MKLRLLLVLTFIPFLSFTQELELVNEYPLKAKPVAVSIDRSGKLYFAYQDGEIERYDQEGNMEFNNSLNKRFSITLLEAWQGLKTFVYSAPFQEYFFLDRFFNNSEFYRVEKDEFRLFDGLATIENDQTLWAFNTESQTLRKVDLFNNEIIFDNQLNLTLSIDAIDPEHLRVYQNLVFISEADHGVAIFDNLGGFLDFISFKGVSYFSFLEDEIILYNGQELRLMNIYNKTKREIPLGNLSFDYILMDNDHLIGLKDKKVQRFKVIN